jgi:hypothetical protein
MKLILTVAALAAIALPAVAQNAGQIARVRGGSSCAGCNLFQGALSGLEARGLNLSGARLRQADLSLTVMAMGNLFGNHIPALAIVPIQAYLRSKGFRPDFGSVRAYLMIAMVPSVRPLAAPNISSSEALT